MNRRVWMDGQEDIASNIFGGFSTDSIPLISSIVSIMSNIHHAPTGHAMDSIVRADTAQGSITGAENIIKPNAQAQHAASEEKTMSLGQALRLYPKAIGWSVLLSTTLIMEGYDLALLGSLYASPQFNMKFGVWNDSTGEYAVPASWQSALSNGARAGEVIGLLINGIASDRFGYRKTMISSLVAMIAFVFVLFSAPNIQTLVLGEVLCGIPWGVFQTLSTAYASEVSPVILRPYLTTFVNMCWVMGQFIAAGVNRASVTRDDQWAYKIPFAIQWVWPPLILAGVIFAPERYVQNVSIMAVSNMSKARGGTFAKVTTKEPSEHCFG